ncbi:MAG: S41 family peptidase [Tissierellia bacterium]|nr:S41 family peptidase [Tissierellia bacterium]
MFKRGLRIFVLILVLTLITPIAANAQIPVKVYEEYQADLIFFEDVLNLIKDNYPFEVDEDELIITAVKSMLKSLDPYSDYYTKEEAKSLYDSLSGNFSGVGMYIEDRDGYVGVVAPIKGQPAEKAGIKAGDLIISVDDIDIKDMGVDKVSSMIKGPAGTTVKLKVKRGERILTFKITRKIVEINPVHYEILEENIGYIRLDDFSSKATKEIKKALEEFNRKGIKKIILDLRDNPGGLLDEAVSVGRLFVPAGPIVYVKDKAGSLKKYESSLRDPKYQLVVLVNERSASASEILAGAIKDRKAGILVGTKTFGKALVQSLIPVNDGSIIKLTTAVYLTPNKTLINGVGIEPDYVVENDGFEDLQLKKAIEVLK